jgi:hypothetical protein
MRSAGRLVFAQAWAILGRLRKILPEEIVPAAYFVVRATVADPSKRAAFGKWYQTEHLPDAA